VTDALETAAACGLTLWPHRPDETSLKAELPSNSRASFDRMIGEWFPLTYVHNNLTPLAWVAGQLPFVLSTPVIEKLRFVHKTVSHS
jgi:hypothetical protein